jgi:hypothetical protein
MPENTTVLTRPPAAVYQVPPLEDAKRQYVELFGSALVMNTYLKIAVLALSIVACGLIVLNVHTMRRFAQIKPLVVRIDEIGRAQAVTYDAMTYKPAGQCPGFSRDQARPIAEAMPIATRMATPHYKANRRIFSVMWGCLLITREESCIVYGCVARLCKEALPTPVTDVQRRR